MTKFCFLIAVAGLLTAGRGAAQGVDGPYNKCAGVVQTEAGEPLPGATVFVKGTYVGTSTNERGEFDLPVGGLDFPLTLNVSFVGCATREVELSAPDGALDVSLAFTARQLSEVVVAASRVEENLLRAPATIEKVTGQQIEKFATPEVFGGLAQLKGVDVNSASMLFTSLSTRGFNTAKSERVVQLYDYADGQLPSLSLSPGNIVGVPELDMESIEIVHGPASALYGSNALNGVILFNSKDPFTYTGLSARVRGGARDYFDGQLRLALRLDRRFAFKFNGSWLSAREWIADDYQAQSFSLNPAGSLLGYDAVNRYGEQALRYNNTAANGDLRNVAFYTPGYTEAELMADDTYARSFRLGGALSYLVRDDVKLTMEAKHAEGTSTYQNLSRFRLRDFGVNQYKVELKGPRGFLRAYSTEDFSGNSYELSSLGNFMANTVINPDVNNTTYVTRYGVNYFNAYTSYKRNNPGTPALDPAALQAAQDFAYSQWLLPGSARFAERREEIISNDVLKSGSRIRFGSFLNDASGQYEFRLPADFSLVAGGAYREFRVGSGGRYFADADNQRIRNYEYGGYGQLSRSLLDDRLKLALAARYDRFKNFGAAFSPRASAVYSLGPKKEHNFRASYGQAYRSPSTPEQYYALDLPRNYVAGNVGTGFQGYAIFNVNPTTGVSEPVVYTDSFGFIRINPRRQDFEQTVDPLRLERVRTYEVGYRGVFGTKVYLDVNFFWSRYTDFVGATRFLGNLDGTRPTEADLYDRANYNSGYSLTGANTRVIYAWVNNPAPVETRGGAVGVQFYWLKQLNLSANYTYNEMTRKPEPYGTFDFTSFYNTPKHKYNVGANGVLRRHLSYSANYRWVQSHFQEMPFASGTVADCSTLDAQVDYAFPKFKTTLQVGASNLLNTNNAQIWGGPQIGRLGFVGLLVELN